MRVLLHSLQVVRSLSYRQLPKPAWRGLCSAVMRLVQFHCHGDEGSVRVGVEHSDGLGVVDLTAFDPSMPSTMRGLLELGDKGLECAQRALSSGQCVVQQSDIRLLSPVLSPDKVVCVGLNYRDHCLEQNAPIPKEPIIFSKFPSAITGPYDDITLPSDSKEVDWEVELAFVIGRRGKHIKEEDALSYVAGFTVANDVSARDWQLNRNGKQWLLGKTFDSFCPLGPALVTTAAVTDPHSLGIRCLVNRERVQNSNTDQMIFKTEALVAWVSKNPSWCGCVQKATKIPEERRRGGMPDRPARIYNQQSGLNCGTNCSEHQFLTESSTHLLKYTN